MRPIDFVGAANGGDNGSIAFELVLQAQCEPPVLCLAICVKELCQKVFGGAAGPAGAIHLRFPGVRQKRPVAACASRCARRRRLVTLPLLTDRSSRFGGTGVRRRAGADGVAHGDRAARSCPDSEQKEPVRPQAPDQNLASSITKRWHCPGASQPGRYDQGRCPVKGRPPRGAPRGAGPGRASPGPGGIR
jgi:hypothetical protein